ncbi:MAG: lysophospholipase [Bacteroidota bacterium]
MKSIDFQWKTADSLAIHAQHWEVDEPTAVVCIVHGLGEHMGRYEHVAAFFAQHQIASFAYDRRGHGKSEGKRGDAPDLETLLDEIETLLVFAKQAYPAKPLFLYGHSLGGNLALNFVLRRKPNIQGVIATGSWIRLPKPPTAFLLGFARLMRRVFPALTQPNGLVLKYLSKDPKVVEAYANDPLVHNRISVRMGLAMLEAANWLDEFSGEMPVPTLIMHGGEDKITDPAGSEAFAKRVSGHVSWKRWEGLFHEIHNEPEQAEVMEYIMVWMKEKLGN